MSEECKHSFGSTNRCRYCNEPAPEIPAFLRRQEAETTVTPLVASRAASAIITAQEQEIERLREKHTALHRRCQQAETALVDYRKLTALPPDGDGVRFVSGNMGRALLTYLCDSQASEIERLRAFVSAWDAWHIADYVADGTETYAAMMAAREAVGELDK